NLSGRADKEYISILRLSAKENETAVDEALRSLIDKGSPLTFEQVEAIVRSGQPCSLLVQKLLIAKRDLKLQNILGSVRV
ncbi:hypothetical protein ISS30_08215, partial [bacterium]|nr:hypothetical protein [bacterium]